MVGGDETAFERCLPVFRAMGKTVIRVGDSGAGQIVKACNQIVVAVNYMALSEALVLGSKAGVDPAKIIEILGGGLANSRVLELRGQKMIQHDFTPGGKVAFHNKDMGIINEVARNYGVPLLAAPLVSQIFTALMQAGHSELDHSAILLFFEQLAQHKLRD
jgi:2-hydroxy-3-oxopropionate reductase